MLPKEYIAGFFDGEGCVSISRDLRMQVRITQKERPVLDLIQSQYGGKVSIKDRKLSEMYTLRIVSSREMATFLTDMLPLSIIKRGEIEIGIQFARLIRTDNKGCNPMTELEVERRNELYEKMAAIKGTKITKGLTESISDYRKKIKEKFNYHCALCGKDLRNSSVIYQIVSDDMLICRPCNGKRYNRELKPLTREQIEKAIFESKTLDEAAEMLNIGRSALLKKRHKLGMIEFPCGVCGEMFKPTQKRKKYCSDNCYNKRRLKQYRDMR